VAGGTVRAVAELAGIPNIMAKTIGSRNPHNLVKAVFLGLSQLKTREQYLSARK
jgi:small subunit ribosomal protein S5